MTVVRNIHRPVGRQDGNGIGVGFGGQSWSSYWTQHLQLNYSQRSGLSLLETGSGSSLNGEILPAAGKIDGSNYLYLAVSNFEAADDASPIETSFYFGGNNGTQELWSSHSESSTARYFRLYVYNKKIYLDIRQNVTTVFQNFLYITNAINAGWHVVKFYPEGGAYKAVLDGGSVLTVGSGLTLSTGTDNGRWLNLITLRSNIVIGAYKDSGGFHYSNITGYVGYVKWGTTHTWYITGQGNYEYDSVGTNHYTWTGSAHLVFDAGGTQGLLDSGYSVWRKHGSSDEYVPYKAGSPNDVSAFLTTYDSTKVTNHAGSATAFNFAPSLVGFNPTGSADSKLTIFDRSNTTRQTAASRSSAYYDSTSLITKCRYHSTEIRNPAVTNTLFNAGYRGLFYQNVTTTYVNYNYFAVSAANFYTLDTDIKGSKQLKAMLQCGTNVFAAVDGSLDADGYILTLLTDIKHFGANPAYSAETNFAAIRSAVNYFYNTALTFGSAGETYRTSQPIYLQSYKTYTVNSTIKIKDALTTTLTQNYTAGDGHIHVSSVTGFNIGEWIGITDNNQTFDYDLWYGMNVPITSIDVNNNIIYFTDTGCIFNYTTAHSAWCGHAQSVFIAENKTDIIFTGSGTIDCNQVNQAAINGLLVSSVFEELRSTSGFAGWISDNITIKGLDNTHRLNFINGLRHNICISGTGSTAANRCDAPIIKWVNCTFGHNKNLNLRYTDSANVSYYTGNDAIWEDGLMFYLSNTNAVIDHIECKRNGRNGVGWNGASSGSLTGTNIETADNIYDGIGISCNNVTLTDVVMSDRLVISNQYDNANNITINNIAISNYHTLVGLYSDSVVALLGEINTIALNELSITNCSMPIGILTTNQFTPSNPPVAVTVTRRGFYTTYPTSKSSLYAGTDITFTDFDNYP